MTKIISFIMWIVVCSGNCSIYGSAQAANVSDYKESMLLSSAFANSIEREQIEWENLSKISILAGLASAMGIIGWQLYRQRPSVKYSSSRNKLTKTKNKALINRVSPKLRRQLLRLINDPKTANRLLMGIYQHNRDRDPDWIAEKVIYDLRRGR